MFLKVLALLLVSVSVVVVRKRKQVNSYEDEIKMRDIRLKSHLESPTRQFPEKIDFVLMGLLV